MSSRQELLKTRALRVEQLAAANESYGNSLASDKKSIRGEFGSGEVATTKRDLKEMRDNIQWIEQDIKRIDNRLRGGSLVRVSLRR